MNKSRHVTFRCIQEQYDAIKKAANHQEISVSSFIVRTLRRKSVGINTSPFYIERTRNRDKP